MTPNIETPNVQQMWHHSLAAEFPQALDMVMENPPFSQMIFPEKTMTNQPGLPCKKIRQILGWSM